MTSGPVDAAWAPDAPARTPAAVRAARAGAARSRDLTSFTIDLRSRGVGGAAEAADVTLNKVDDHVKRPGS
ncbi:hypothetical protein GCM10009802_53730 [Streptomyces synnematoformans]|uniref:Uncharacterized protein n=1 Tax=Streptomyces synnematoformans TaxID=415721 RepID=A0ABP4K8B0_9ACTN